MSPIDRDRARERRRYEKRQVALAARAAERRRNRQVVVVVVAVLLVIGAFVGLSTVLGKQSTSTPAAAKTPASTASAAGASPSTSAGATLAAGCTTPPSAPTSAAVEKLPAKTLAAGATWTARIVTTCGAITVDLDGAKAPQTVSSFIALARSGYFAKSPCHRLTTAGLFVLQCGDPTGTGEGGPGYGFGIENAPASGRYPTGTLAMARSTDPNTNGSQFFIVYKPTTFPTAGGGYSIFGRVTSGLSVIDNVAAKGVLHGGSDGAPASPVSILSVAVTHKKA